MSGWAPERGDIVWIDMDPCSGHEESGRRLALVLSPSRYNRTVGLAILCPVTGAAKGFPFEVAVPDGLPVSGVVLADHAKSLDWRSREAEFVCGVPEETVSNVAGRLMRLVAR